MVGIQSAAQVQSWLVSGRILFLLIHFLGIGCFFYIVARRMAPLVRGERDFRFDQPWARLRQVLKFWLGQWKQPRYRFAGTLHILIFAGFILLAMRAFSTLIAGVSENFVMPGLPGRAGPVYDLITDYAASIVLICMVIAVIRRLVFQPARYAVPAKYGKAHTADAIFLLSLIALLMIADSLFAAARAASRAQAGQSFATLATYSLPWILRNAVASLPLPALGMILFGAYLAHELGFYFLLCYRPFGIQFHVETFSFQYLFCEAGPGDSQTGALRRERRAPRSADIFWREEVRGFHLEADAGFLFLRRLWALFRQLSGECGGPAAVSAIPYDQGEGLQLPALSRVRARAERQRSDRQ